MSAEIEQQDANANSTSSQNENTANSSSGVDATLSNARAGLRAVRKVKQPVSYAEPSTKSKLRRGDVVFPKVDALDKNKVTGGGGGAPESSTSSSSGLADLNRINKDMDNIINSATKLGIGDDNDEDDDTLSSVVGIKNEMQQLTGGTWGGTTNTAVAAAAAAAAAAAVTVTKVKEPNYNYTDIDMEDASPSDITTPTKNGQDDKLSTAVDGDSKPPAAVDGDKKPPAATDNDVITIAKLEVFDIKSLKNKITKCGCRGCNLSAVICVEVNGTNKVLCNDHLEEDNQLNGWPANTSVYPSKFYLTDEHREAILEYGCSNKHPFTRENAGHPPINLPPSEEAAAWYSLYEASSELPSPSMVATGGSKEISLDNPPNDLASVVGGTGVGLVASPLNNNNLNVQSPEDVRVLQEQVEGTGPDIEYPGRTDFVSIINNLTEKHTSIAVVLLLAQGIMVLAYKAPVGVMSWIGRHLNFLGMSTSEWYKRKMEILPKDFMESLDEVGPKTIMNMFSGEGYTQADLHEDKFDVWCRLLQEYKDDGNDVTVYDVGDFKGRKLGQWLISTRHKIKLGELHDRRVEKLKKIGVVLDITNYNFDRAYGLVQQYVAENGHYPPQAAIRNGVKIGEWWQNRKAEYSETNNKKGGLSKKQLQMLKNELPLGGVDKPYTIQDKTWDDNLDKYNEWKKQNDNQEPRYQIYEKNEKNKWVVLNKNKMTPAQQEEVKLGLWAETTKKTHKESGFKQSGYAEERITGLALAGILPFSLLGVRQPSPKKATAGKKKAPKDGEGKTKTTTKKRRAE